MIFNSGGDGGIFRKRGYLYFPLNPRHPPTRESTFCHRVSLVSTTPEDLHPSVSFCYLQTSGARRATLPHTNLPEINTNWLHYVPNSIVGTK